MTHLVTILTVLLCGFHFASWSKETKVASAILLLRDHPDQLPGFLKNVCTAASIDMNAQQMICTAAHCLRSTDPNHHVDIYTDAGTTFYGVIYQSSYRIKFPIKNIKINWEDDTACTPSRLTKSIKAQFDRPQVGSMVEIVGYPKGRGPRKISCTYLGRAITISQQVHTILDMADCPKVDPRGTSGSPILDSAGNSLGILTSFYRKNEEYIRIFFKAFADYQFSPTLGLIPKTRAASEEAIIQNPLTDEQFIGKITYNDLGIINSIMLTRADGISEQVAFETDKKFSTYRQFDPYGHEIIRKHLERGRIK